VFCASLRKGLAWSAAAAAIFSRTGRTGSSSSH